MPVAAVDDLGAQQFTYIKMDVEGAEAATLAGAEKTIKRCKPKLLMAAYHHDADLWRLPLMVWNLRPDYQVFLRRHPYVPCWEINIFAT